MIETYRCMNDGRLLTDSLCRMGFCAGHYMKQPVILSVGELVLLKLGIYELYARKTWALWQSLSR